MQGQRRVCDRWLKEAAVTTRDLTTTSREWLPAPGATATFVATFEFVGGILLALGLLSRVVALGLVIDMTTAYLTADREAFFSSFSDPNKFAAADPFVFLFIGLLILIFGSGKISLDAFREHIVKKRALHAGSSVTA